MRIVVCLAACFLWAAAAADVRSSWSESAKVFFVLEGVDDADAIAKVDAALAPFGWKRDSGEVQPPRNLAPGIHASYNNGSLARAILVQAARPGCLMLSTANYDTGRPNLAAGAGTAVTVRLLAEYAGRIRFYADADCHTAL